MSCNHKRVWEMDVTAEWQDNVRCLEQGFEPFAVDRQFIYFKRLKPCEECGKANNTGRFPSEIFDEYKKKHGI